MKTGIIGAGAWGTALAQTIASDGSEVVLWARESDVVEAIVTTRENTPFLPGIALSPLIEPTVALNDLAACDVLIAVTPAQHLRTVLLQAPIGVRTLVLCAKGIEVGTMLLMSEVAREICPSALVAVLSGPTFAREVAEGKPTAVTLAGESIDRTRALALRLARPAFRPYVTDDVIGAEIGGAIKNVLAIACGVVAGLGLGENARAALIARGFAEMARFGLARGARAETLSGLSGLGDLVLTCSSMQSRNFSLGKALGEGKSAAAILESRATVAEGAATAPVLQAAARAIDVDMPVVDAVCSLLSGEAEVRDVATALLARPLRREV